MPSDRVPALLKWTHESSGHVGAERTLRLFKHYVDGRPTAENPPAYRGQVPVPVL